MTKFAHGTNKDYANAFDNWWFGGGAQSGQEAPQRSSYGPDSQPAGAPKPMNMSAYSPGRAQPIQPPSQGTQYGARPQYETLGGGANDPRWAENGGHWGSRSGQQPSQRGGSYDAWKQSAGVQGTPNLRQMQDYIAQNKRSRKSPMAQTANQPQAGGGYGSFIGREGPQWGDFRDSDNDNTDDRWQTGPGQASQQFQDGGMGGYGFQRNPTQQWSDTGVSYNPSTGQATRNNVGNVANSAAGRPPSFNTSMTDQYGMPTTQEQYWPQQQAFMQSMIDRLGQIQTGTYLGPGAPPSDFGATPAMDFPSMWSQAGGLVQQGWQNPMMGMFRR